MTAGNSTADRAWKRSVIGRAVTAAVNQALDELGWPDHPAGACPGDGCQCDRWEQIATARATELVAVRLGTPFPRRVEGPVENG